MIQSQHPMLKKFAPIIVILAAAALGIFLSMGSFTAKSVAQATTTPSANTDETASTPATQPQTQETDTMPKQQWSEAPKMTIDINKTYTAHMETTLGNID